MFKLKRGSRGLSQRSEVRCQKRQQLKNRTVHDNRNNERDKEDDHCSIAGSVTESSDSENVESFTDENPSNFTTVRTYSWL